LSRDRKYLLDEAIPLKPSTDEMLTHLISSAVGNGLTVELITVDHVKLISSETNKTLPDVKINMKIKGEYSSVVNFTKQIMDQRRLKTINKISIATIEDEVSSASSGLLTTVNISGYFR